MHQEEEDLGLEQGHGLGTDAPETGSVAARLRLVSVRGNDHSPLFENQLMLVSAEIMEVVRDLCRLAAAWNVLGRIDKAAALLEQSAVLLAERARHITAERATPLWVLEGLQ